tara:strand:- start:47 stop:601 length:555 start_codon:yes stop_codon:yes gene_type:complete
MGRAAEVEELGPSEEVTEAAFDWQEAQRKDEAEVSELRQPALPKIKPEVIHTMRQLKKPFALSRVKPRKGHGGGTLHYIDARDVMFRLDEVIGPLNWQDTYKEVMGRIICTLSIRFGDEWISKEDGAGDTKIEGDKGGISDAFKRAAVKWGCGRYLYYFPKDGSIPSWADPNSGKWTNDTADRI